MIADPNRYARLGGLMYVAIIALGTFGELFARGSLVVAGDPAATLENIRGSELLWRAGIAGNLLHLSCGVVLAMVYYVLFRPVSLPLTVLAVMFNLVAIIVEAVSKVFLMLALFVVGGGEYLRAFSPDQLQVLAYLEQRLHSFGFNFSLVFFAFECLVLGHLVYHSRFLPRILGVLMALAGVCYLVNSFALLLAPRISNVIVPGILVPIFIGETALALWLLFKGVNVPVWRERAASGDR